MKSLRHRICGIEEVGGPFRYSVQYFEYLSYINYAYACGYPDFTSDEIESNRE